MPSGLLIPRIKVTARGYSLWVPSRRAEAPGPLTLTNRPSGTVVRPGDGDSDVPIREPQPDHSATLASVIARATGRRLRRSRSPSPWPPSMRPRSTSSAWVTVIAGVSFIAVAHIRYSGLPPASCRSTIRPSASDVGKSATAIPRCPTIRRANRYPTTRGCCVGSRLHPKCNRVPHQWATWMNPPLFSLKCSGPLLDVSFGATVTGERRPGWQDDHIWLPPRAGVTPLLAKEEGRQMSLNAGRVSMPTAASAGKRRAGIRPHWRKMILALHGVLAKLGLALTASLLISLYLIVGPTPPTGATTVRPHVLHM